MRLLILVLVMVLFCIDVSAQKATVQKKASGADKPGVVARKGVDRYEILVFPELVIRLDTFTGQTYSQIVSKKWSLAYVSGGLPDESSNSVSKYRVWREEPDRSAGRFTSYIYYLMNTETGQTWISINSASAKSVASWDPFSDN